MALGFSDEARQNWRGCTNRRWRTGDIEKNSNARYSLVERLADLGGKVKVEQDKPN
jgi:hypothetical protein